MVFSIASQKSGVGKTSSSISLSAGLARKGKSVLLIDIDSQANSSKVLLAHYPQLQKHQTIYTTILERNPLPIHKTHIPTLDIVPSHILLSNTDVTLTTAIDHREERLKRQLDPVKDSYDFIFIDCPPTLSWLTINAMTASDKVIVIVSPGRLIPLGPACPHVVMSGAIRGPASARHRQDADRAGSNGISLSPGYFELDSIVQIGKTIEEVKAYFNQNIALAGFLFTMRIQQSTARHLSRSSDRPTRAVFLTPLFPAILIFATHILKRKTFSLSILTLPPRTLTIN